MYPGDFRRRQLGRIGVTAQHITAETFSDKQISSDRAVTEPAFEGQEVSISPQNLARRIGPRNLGRYHPDLAQIRQKKREIRCRHQSRAAGPLAGRH
jgi:hypothetical protein